jgi:glutaredoxin
MLKPLLSFTVAAVLLSAPAFGTKLYRVVDEDGNVSYQDREPDGGTAKVEQREVHDGASSHLDASEPSAATGPVTLYVVPDCVTCDYVRSLLEKREVPFKTVDVGTDVASQEALKKRAGDLSVPVLMIGNRVLKGYVEPILKAELDKAGYTEIAQNGDSE